MDDATQRDSITIDRGERAEVLLIFGVIAVLGSFAPVVTMVWATFVAEHDFIADTLSDLARGPHKIIMDVGFYVNAVALVSLAIAAAHVHLGRVGWTLGVLCLALLALVVSLLGLFDHFHRRLGPDETASVHTRISMVLGPLYLAGPLLMARGIAQIGRRYAALFRDVGRGVDRLCRALPAGADGI